MKKYFFSTGFIILIIGIVILYTGGFSGYYGTSIYFDNEKYFFGIFFILLSFFISYFELFKKTKKKIEYSKCPKCEDTFTYSELEDGMCPKCNIKTIDMEKYYDKN